VRFYVVAFVSLIGNDDTTSLDPALNFQAASDGLVVVVTYRASLDVALDLQATSGGLVVVGGNKARLDPVRLRAAVWLWLLLRVPAFTFVLIFIYAYSFFGISVEPRRRHNLGFEADGYSPLLRKATMRGENLHGAEKYFRGSWRNGKAGR
jgi:hypothetical protein